MKFGRVQNILPKSEKMDYVESVNHYKITFIKKNKINDFGNFCILLSLYFILSV